MIRGWESTALVERAPQCPVFVVQHPVIWNVLIIIACKDGLVHVRSSRILKVKQTKRDEGEVTQTMFNGRTRPLCHQGEANHLSHFFYGTRSTNSTWHPFGSSLELENTEETVTIDKDMNSRMELMRFYFVSNIPDTYFSCSCNLRTIVRSALASRGSSSSCPIPL